MMTKYDLSYLQDMIYDAGKDIFNNLQRATKYPDGEAPKQIDHRKYRKQKQMESLQKTTLKVEFFKQLQVELQELGFDIQIDENVTLKQLQQQLKKLYSQKRDELKKSGTAKQKDYMELKERYKTAKILIQSYLQPKPKNVKSINDKEKKYTKSVVFALQQQESQHRKVVNFLLKRAKEIRRREKRQIARDTEILNAIRQSYIEELQNTQDEDRRSELQNRIDKLEKDADIASEVEKILLDTKKFVEKISELEKVAERLQNQNDIQSDERNEIYKQFVYNHYKQKDDTIREIFDAIKMSNDKYELSRAFTRHMYNLKDEYLNSEFYAILCDYIRDNYENYENEREQIEAFLSKKAKEFNADAKFDAQFEQMQMQKTNISEKTLIDDTISYTNTIKR